MQIESTLFHAINSLQGQVPFVDQFMLAMSDQNTWIFATMTATVLAWRTKNFEILSIMLVAAVALGAADLISFEIIKPLIARERPCWIIAAKTINGHCGGSYGFTSNHAANGFAVWAVFAWYLKPLSWRAQMILTCATVVSISRVYLGVHFVGDVLGGALLGAAVGASICALRLKVITDKIFKIRHD